MEACWIWKEVREYFFETFFHFFNVECVFVNTLNFFQTSIFYMIFFFVLFSIAIFSYIFFIKSVEFLHSNESQCNNIFLT